MSISGAETLAELYARNNNTSPINQDFARIELTPQSIRTFEIEYI